MSEASKALAKVRGWLCDNLDASDAGHVCGMLSVVSRRVVQADELESENDKLREMCTALYKCRDKVSACETCEDVACPFMNDCRLHDRMRVLGVEL